MQTYHFFFVVNIFVFSLRNLSNDCLFFFPDRCPIVLAPLCWFSTPSRESPSLCPSPCGLMWFATLWVSTWNSSSSFMLNCAVPLCNIANPLRAAHSWSSCLLDYSGLLGRTRAGLCTVWNVFPYCGLNQLRLPWIHRWAYSCTIKSSLPRISHSLHQVRAQLKCKSFRLTNLLLAFLPISSQARKLLDSKK